MESFHLDVLETFSKRTPIVFLVLDGFGIGVHDPQKNPVVVVDPPTLNQLSSRAKQQSLYTVLTAHGPAVGLEEDAQGNSEVGHNAMGAGRVYPQGAKLVGASLASGAVFQTPTWHRVVTEVAQRKGTLHFYGLLSDGGIHSHIHQLFQLMDGAVRSGIRRIRVHILLDGRDVPPSSSPTYITLLEQKISELRDQNGVDALIASGGGRMWVMMDRYESDWTIVRRGWDAFVHGVVLPEDLTPEYPGYFHSALEAVLCARQVFPSKLDQYNPPFVIVDEDGHPLGTMKDGDGVINFNFRGDRSLQSSKAFDSLDEDFPFFDRSPRPDVQYAGLLEYDTEAHVPRQFLVSPPNISSTVSCYLAAQHIRSYACAETHKLGHVTYFWNGNRSGYIDRALEVYEEIPSLPNRLTESHPEMKAVEVCDHLVNAIRSERFDFLRCNFANPDMVGHTGNWESCVRCIRVIDEQLARIWEVVEEKGGILIITSDHGNVEDKNPAKATKTSHTTAPVFFILQDARYDGTYTLYGPDEATPDRDSYGKGLTNVAATLCNLLGFKAPWIYRHSLLKLRSGEPVMSAPSGVPHDPTSPPGPQPSPNIPQTSTSHG